MYDRLIQELPVVAVAIDEFQAGIDKFGDKIVSRKELPSEIVAASAKTKVTEYARGLSSVLLKAASMKHSVICCGTSNDIIKMNQLVASETGREALHLVDWQTLEYKNLVNTLTKLFDLNEEIVRYAFDEGKWKLFRPRFLEMIIQRLIPTFRINMHINTKKNKDIAKIYTHTAHTIE